MHESRFGRPGPGRGPAPQGPDASAVLVAFPLHVVLGLLSAFAAALAFGWLAPLVHALFDEAFPITRDWEAVALHPIREELAKGLMLAVGALVLSSWPALRIRTGLGPAFAAPALGIGLGFAVLETAFNKDAAGGAGFLAATVYRAWGHSLCVGWTALGAALAVRRRWWWALPVALAAAMVLHGGNNLIGRRSDGPAQFLWVAGASVVLAVLCGLLQSHLAEWPPRPAAKRDQDLREGHEA